MKLWIVLGAALAIAFVAAAFALRHTQAQVAPVSPDLILLGRTSVGTAQLYRVQDRANGRICYVVQNHNAGSVAVACH